MVSYLDSGGGGQVIAFYSDDLSSNLVKAISFLNTICV